MPDPTASRSPAPFRRLFRSLVLDPAMILARALDAGDLARVVAEAAGRDRAPLFTPAVTVAVFLSRVGSDDHSCRGAVEPRIVGGFPFHPPPSASTMIPPRSQSGPSLDALPIGNAPAPARVPSLSGSGRRSPMNNRRAFLLTLTAGVMALGVIVAPVIADERFGVITDVDVEGETLTVREKGADEGHRGHHHRRHGDRLRRGRGAQEGRPGGAGRGTSRSPRTRGRRGSSPGSPASRGSPRGSASSPGRRKRRRTGDPSATTTSGPSPGRMTGPGPRDRVDRPARRPMVVEVGLTVEGGPIPTVSRTVSPQVAGSQVTYATG